MIAIRHGIPADHEVTIHHELQILKSHTISRLIKAISVKAILLKNSNLVRYETAV